MQKFQKGDLVRIAKDLGPSMSHFPADCDAVVIGSYKDKYGGDDTNNYTLHLKGSGQTSWYYENQLTLIKANQMSLLDTWQKDEKAEEELHGNLDWIFSNGKEVMNKGYGASLQSLANCFGLTNLWGCRGEGFIYYQNAVGTLNIAAPYLEKGDKEGYLEHCETLKEQS